VNIRTQRFIYTWQFTEYINKYNLARTMLTQWKQSCLHRPSHFCWKTHMLKKRLVGLMIKNQIKITQNTARIHTNSFSVISCYKECKYCPNHFGKLHCKNVDLLKNAHCLYFISPLIMYLQNVQHADWLRARQSVPNSSECKIEWRTKLKLNWMRSWTSSQQPSWHKGKKLL